MKRIAASVFWILLALAGGWAYAVLTATHREHLNSIYILVAALCTYAIGYRFYSKWIATRVLMLNDRRATPCEVHDDGKDFVKTNRWIVFGHHFAAISGPGPLVGPVLAAQFGYLPGTLWILLGVVLGGAVQDLVILFCSIRRDGKSLAQMIREELGAPAGIISVIAVLSILVILLAVLALVVVNALGESPWGVFTVGSTIPIAMFMGGYLRFWRVGRILEVTVLGVVLLLSAVWGGQYVYHHPDLARYFGFGKEPIAWAIIVYGLAASVLPVWLLLAPRDYLSTFMKLGTILALACGVLLVLPELKMPALTRFVDGSGPVVPGNIFPFCFITIACGAISGFHTLVASGITPKIITRERYARSIGYGAMCLESLVAIMALIAACTLEPGVYLSMNLDVGDLPQIEKVSATTAVVRSQGFAVTTEQMTALAQEVGEPSLVGKTGGAVTLAVGMADIFSRVTHGRWLDLWYHFAIMFEALFILTTIDAGTRVGRYLLQDALGYVCKPMRQTRHWGANLAASTGMVLAWGFFLILGVRDPEGGVRALWPIFGISNQMLAGIALCLATTVILKMALGGQSVAADAEDRNEGLQGGRGSRVESREQETANLKSQISNLKFPKDGGDIQQPTSNIQDSISARSSLSRRTGEGRGEGPGEGRGGGKAAVALITVIPLLWLLAVTMTAGGEKIFHSKPNIGFLAANRVLREQLPRLEAGLAQAAAAGDAAAVAKAAKSLRVNEMKRFNNSIDAIATGFFMLLVGLIVVLSARQWILLLRRRVPAQLHETPPIWLPEAPIPAGPRIRAATLLAFGVALARELSGEAQLERARQEAAVCSRGEIREGEAQAVKSDGQLYVEVTEKRFNGVRRCC